MASLGIQIWSADFPADDWRHVSASRVYDLAIKRLEAKQVVFTSTTWMNNGKDDVREVTKVIQAPAGGQEGPASEAKQQ